MERILFVTGSAGGIGVWNRQHLNALRKSNGGSRSVLNTWLMRSVTMSLPSDKPHNDFLANRSNVIPSANNITVQGILEKSWLAGALNPVDLRPRLPDHTAIVLRHSHIKDGQESRNHKALSHTGILISSRFWSA
jgi:hypothetical protein